MVGWSKISGSLSLFLSWPIEGGIELGDVDQHLLE
jgi:hypothetical protein